MLLKDHLKQLYSKQLLAQTIFWYQWDNNEGQYKMTVPMITTVATNLSRSDNQMT